MHRYRLLVLVLSVLAFGFIAKVHAQDIPAATRGDIEAGFTFTTDNPDTTGILKGHNGAIAPTYRTWGGSAYVNVNLNSHIGLTAQFDYPTYHTPADFLEKSYMIGIRYIAPVKYRYVPYVKVLGGFASTSYDVSNPYILVSGVPGTYASYAVGAGLDVRFSHRITVRAIDLQLEDWPGFPGGSIHPVLISIGAAYRFK